MPDINLLPDNLKKKAKNSFDKKNNFGHREIEFTSGKSLKKDYEDDEIDAVDKLFKWIKPKPEDNNNSREKDIVYVDKKNLIPEKININENSEYDIKFDKIKDEKVKTKNKKSGSFFSSLFNKKNLKTPQETKKDSKNFIKDQKLNNKNTLKIGNGTPKNFFENNYSKENKAAGNFQDFNDIKIINTKYPDYNQSQNNIKIKNVIQKPISDTQVVQPIKQQTVYNKNTNQNKNIKQDKPKKTKFSIKNIFNKNKKNFSEQKDNDLGVNLLPEGINIPSGKNLLFVLLSTFIISCVAVMVVYFALNIYEIKLVNKYKDINLEASTYESSLESYDDLISKIQLWSLKTEKIRTLFNKHVYWTKFFETIEKNTMPEVKFSTFSGSLNGNLTLSAQAPSYETFVKQWTYWNNSKNFVDSVIISGASLSSNGVSDTVNFSVTFDFVDDIFYISDNASSTDINEKNKDTQDIDKKLKDKNIENNN